MRSWSARRAAGRDWLGTSQRSSDFWRDQRCLVATYSLRLDVRSTLRYKLRIALFRSRAPGNSSETAMGRGSLAGLRWYQYRKEIRLCVFFFNIDQTFHPRILESSQPFLLLFYRNKSKIEVPSNIVRWSFEEESRRCWQCVTYFIFYMT